MILTLIILTIGIIGYVVDLNTNKYFQERKKDIGLNLYLLFHHVLAVFIILGLFYNKPNILKVYVVTLLVVFISWYIFKGHCIITLSTNKYCKVDSNVQFRSIFAKSYKWIKNKFSKNTKDSCVIAPESKKCVGQINQTYNLFQYYLLPILITLGLIKIGFLSKKKRK